MRACGLSQMSQAQSKQVRKQKSIRKRAPTPTPQRGPLGSGVPSFTHALSFTLSISISIALFPLSLAAGAGRAGRCVSSELRRRRAVADRWVARAQRRRWWRLAGVVLVVALIGGAVWAAWFSSLLAVHQVSVVGLTDEGELVGGQEVRSAASIPVGMPIARLDTASAQAQVLELPWVASVEVRRAWPQDVVIVVTERSPVAVVKQGEDRRGVDAEGNIFDPPGGLWLTDPIIRGDDSAIAEAVKVASSLPADLEKRCLLYTSDAADE